MATPASSVTLTENPVAIDNPILDFVLQYWLGKRGTRAMPARADIVVTQMKKYLGWISLFEVLPGEDDYRYRIIGTRTTEYFNAARAGITLRQAHAEAKSDKEFTNNVLAIFRETCSRRVPLRVTGAGGEWRGHVYPDFDALYLPLSDDGVTVNMVLNVFTFHYAEYVKTKSLYALTGR